MTLLSFYYSVIKTGAVFTLGTVAPLGTITTLRPVTAVAAGQDGRKLHVQFFDADGHEAQDVFIDRQLTFHFLDRCGRRIDAGVGLRRTKAAAHWKRMPSLHS